MQTLLSEQPAYLCGVCRVQLIRSIPSVIRAGSSLRLDLICATEFNEPLQPHSSSVEAADRYALAFRGNVEIQGGCMSITSTNGASAGQTKVTLSFPTAPGSYTLSVRAINTTSEWMVLPLETEHFLIVSEQEYASKWAGQYIPKLLCCYRTVVYNDRSVRVKEEYGSTIGSHIYDSSIIIVRHLQEYLEDAFDHAHAVNAGDAVDAAGRIADTTRSPVTVLELGAGCGLVGIWCAQILSGMLSTEGPTRVAAHSEQDSAAEGHAARVAEQLSADDRPRCSKALDCRYQVHLTDKANQLPLLTYNVQQAHASSPPHDAVRTRCVVLDWSSTAQISAYQASLAGAPVDLIVAGDVFYDREIARLFATLVRQVSTPGVTKVLVAQKLRKNADNIAVALIGETEMRAMFGYDSIALVRAEADVLLWSMLVC